MPDILDSITSIHETSSEVKVLENSIRNTNTKIVDLEAEAGSIMVNFTLNNNGTEKLWDYENFNLLITYDADIQGVKTRVTEEMEYTTSLVCCDVTVQRGVTVFGAAGDTTTEIIDSVASIGNDGNSFVKITNVQYASAGPDAGTTGNRNNDDIGVRAQLTATNQITFTRLAAGADEDVRVAWEVWEYTGEPGGPNEFIVRLDTEVTVPDEDPVDTNIPNIDDINNLVPIITGVTSDSNGRDWDDATHIVEIIDTGGGLADVRVDRDGQDDEAIVGVAVVEFTGTNWIIQNNISHVFTVSTVQTEIITAVNSWNEAFISSSFHTRDNRNDREEIGYNVWPGGANNLINFDVDDDVGGLGPRFRAVVHLVENPGLSVQHLDSNTGGEIDLPDGPDGAHTVTRNISQVKELSETGLLSTIFNDGGDRDYPKPFWNYRLSSDDTVEFFRSRSNDGLSTWTLQVIEFPGTEKAGTGPCFGGFIRNSLWTVDGIFNDKLDPGLLNQNEGLQVCSGIQYPIFPGGEIIIALSTDRGIISTTSTTVS
jgi:hypothetical protein